MTSKPRVFQPKPNAVLRLDYTNYRGERSTRVVDFLRIEFHSTSYHPTPQFLLVAFDHGKQDIRHFAMRDIHDYEEL